MNFGSHKVTTENKALSMTTEKTFTNKIVNQLLFNAPYTNQQF